MEKIKYIFLFFFFAGTAVFAQQDPLSSYYMYNYTPYNPGFSGTSGLIDATFINRQQWVGFKGAPVTTSFSINAPVSIFKIKSGVGLVFENDNIGFDSNNRISGIYSYILDIGIGDLGIGVNLGVLNVAIDPTWIIPEGSDFTSADQDPSIPSGGESYAAFDGGFGVWLKGNKYYAGISVSHINEPKIKYSEATPYYTRHFYVTGGYDYVFPNPSFELLPSVFGLINGKVMQASATAILRYNKKVWGGLGYRSGDALIGIFGIELYNGLRIGYAYDYPVNDIRKGSGGSHEIMVNYSFELNFGKSPMKYKSIRFL